MIEINSDHEEIAEYIVKKIASDRTHVIEQQSIRQYFTNPYRLHEYDLALKLLKDFDVIRHNNNGRLTPGNSFYTYRSLKKLYKPRVDWKFWIATIIAVFSTTSAFYFGYTDRQNKTTIDRLEKVNRQILTSKDSLLEEVIYLDSLNKSNKIIKVDSVSNKK